MLVQRRARLRGVAAASLGPWLPAPLWRRLARFGSASPAASRPLLTPIWRARLETEHEWLRLGLPRPPSDHFADAGAAFSEMDFGDYRKGILAGWGIDKRDATADLRLIEFCLSLPLEMLMAEGTRRPLARAALADRLPPAVLDERRKGYQAADWHLGLSRDRPRIAELIERIAADDEASSVIDVASLRGLLESWPEGGWHRPETIARYRVGMLQALAAGHFLLAARQSAV
jgi:asparagine synthase (glutamine-hydrolysing)